MLWKFFLFFSIMQLIISKSSLSIQYGGFIKTFYEKNYYYSIIFQNLKIFVMLSKILYKRINFSCVFFQLIVLFCNSLHSNRDPMGPVVPLLLPYIYKSFYLIKTAYHLSKKHTHMLLIKGNFSPILSKFNQHIS